MKEIISQHWVDIISLLISALSTFIAIRANRRVTVLHHQDIQEPLYADVKRLLDYKCDYYSAEKKVMGCYTAFAQISEFDEETIKRKVCRYFGKNEYDKLCNILDLCTKARNIDFDMGILFGLIKEGRPEEYDKLQEALISQESGVSEQKNVEAFLSTISIPFYQISEEMQGKSYDYLELSKSLAELSKRIMEQRKDFESSVEGKMKKK